MQIYVECDKGLQKVLSQKTRHMADLKAKTKYGSDGKNVLVVFKDGKESEIYESKSQIFSQLPNMVTTGKITKEEMSEIAEDILSAKNLPDDIDSDFDSLGNLFADLSFFAIGAAISRVVGRSTSDHKFVVETFPELKNAAWETKDPIFRKCACGKRHAFILFSAEAKKCEDCKEGIGTLACVSPLIHTKNEGMDCVDKYIKNTQKLAPEVEEKLRRAIQDSDLPMMAGGRQDKADEKRTGQN